MNTQPSETHHHIVFLQGDFVQIPELELPSPQTYTKAIYSQTSLSEVHERIHNASILVISALKIDAAALSAEVAPHLKLIVIVAAGSDCVDLQACKKRGIAVSNSPGQNFETVSEHAIGLYFTTRRKMIDMHMLTRAGKWPRERTLMFHMLDKDGTPPLTCQEEVVGIIGNGSVGKRIAELARLLGMKVLVSGRKIPSQPSLQNGATHEIGDRVRFDTVIRQSTVLFLAVPLNESTRHLISTPEFEVMSPHALVINASRGGIVDEKALVAALKANRLAGAATDVFVEEPAGPGNSPLLGEDTRDLNLTVTPHVAWVSQKTAVNYARTMKRAIEEWCAGRAYNKIV